MHGSLIFMMTRWKTMADVFDQMIKDAQKHVKSKAKEIETTMKSVINKDTGALAESVETQKLSSSHYLVGINQQKLMSDSRNKGGIDYTPYYYHGSRPHTIRAKNGGTLSWVGKDGQRHYAKVVHHPGNKPHDFLGDTLKRIK